MLALLDGHDALELEHPLLSMVHPAFWSESQMLKHACLLQAMHAIHEVIKCRHCLRLGLASSETHTPCMHNINTLAHIRWLSTLQCRSMNPALYSQPPYSQELSPSPSAFLGCCQAVAHVLAVDGLPGVPSGELEVKMCITATARRLPMQCTTFQECPQESSFKAL